MSKNIISLLTLIFAILGVAVNYINRNVSKITTRSGDIPLQFKRLHLGHYHFVTHYCSTTNMFYCDIAEGYDLALCNKYSDKAL